MLALAAGAQLLGGVASGGEVAGREGGDRARAHERRLRLDAQRPRQLEAALVHALEALGAVAVEGVERGGERGQQLQLALGVGRQRERALERPHGARVVVQALRGVGGADVVAIRLVERARRLVLRRQHARVRPGTFEGAATRRCCARRCAGPSRS